MSETIKKENPLLNLDEKTEIKDSAELKKQKTYQKFKRNQLLNDLLPLSGFIVLFIIYTIVCLANGYTYTDYLWATFDRGVFIALMSIGASFLFTLGQFDMSLGSAMGLSACVGLLVYMSTGNIALSIISCILGAMLVALCNILFSSVLRVPIFIMSIAMMAVLQQVILAFITTFGEKGSSQINLSPNPFYLDEYGIKWVNDTLNSMTLDEKIGQLFHLVAYSNHEKVLDHMV